MENEEILRRIRDEEESSIGTHEEFAEFCQKNDVFYHYGEGYQIRALISNEHEFIDFVQKVGIFDLWDRLIPFFVNNPTDFEKWFECKDSARTSEMDLVETFQFEDEEPEVMSLTFFPTEKKEVFTVGYNPYFEKPFRIRKETVLVYGEQDIRVKDEVKQKFPAIVTFVSHDTFDRIGAIQGHDLQIISLSQLTNKPVFA